MIRKLLSVLFIIVVIGVIAGGYIYLKNRNKPVPQLIKAIPIDASFFFEGGNFIKTVSGLAQNNKIIEELSMIHEFSTFITSLKYLDSLSIENNEINDLILNKAFAISAHHSGNNKMDYLFLVRLEEILQEKLALNAILNHFSYIHGRDYEKTKIYSVFSNINDKTTDFFFTITSGLIMISQSEILLESAIRQINSAPSIHELNGFEKVFATAGENVDGNLYINYKQFKKTIALAINNQFTKILNGTNNYANWSELDINIRPESILLNGFTYSNDSSKMLMNIFKGQNAHKNDIQEILPANTSLLLALSIDDYSLYINNYKNRFIENKKNNHFLKQNQSLQKNTEIDINENLKSFFNNQIALVFTDISNLSRQENTFVVIKAKSQSQCKEMLGQLVKDYSGLKGIKTDRFKSDIQIDNETKFKVYKMPFNHYAYKMFGELFNMATCNYYCFIDNYLVFGHSPKMLKTFVHANILHKTILNEKQYNEFYNNLSSKSNLYFYCNISRSAILFKHFLSNSLNDLIRENEDIFNKFQAIGFQFTESRNMFYNNLFIKYNPTYKGESKTLWESHLDTSVLSKPYIVRNHYTQNKEIFVQDLKNNIYLINNKGRILWKKKLNEKILSKVYQIDFYKNGKLQLLFNTRSKIHLIDRNGNYVERYPIKLSGTASNGISVFDYDNNKNYRIFIALNNKRIKVYNTEGNIVPGWKFDHTEYRVKKEILHYRLEKKDFIVFADSMRVYILDRRGNERVKLKKQFSVSYYNNFILEKGNVNTDNRLVTTDSKGTIHYIYFNGNVETIATEKLPPSHFFEYQDIDGDNTRDFIYTNNNQLIVQNSKNEKIFSYAFDKQIKNPPVTYTFPHGEKRIGIVISGENLIYLFSENGKLVNGFPITGRSLFSIGKLNPKQEKFNLVVGGEDNFLYNYYLN